MDDGPESQRWFPVKWAFPQDAWIAKDVKLVRSGQLFKATQHFWETAHDPDKKANRKILMKCMYNEFLDGRIVYAYKKIMICSCTHNPDLFDMIKSNSACLSTDH